MDELLKKLKQEYLEQIPEKIKEIQHLFDNNKITELRNSFHKLKGSGKTYGVAPISIISERMEKICSESPDKVNQEIIDLYKAILEDIKDQIITSEEETFKDPRFRALQ